jgi:leader peptidase (prepilin peptidase)/N-methyltransferase
MTWYAQPALALGFYGLLAGSLVPVLIARIPEPVEEPPEETEPAPTDAQVEAGEPVGETTEPDPPKEPYQSIARSRGLRAGASLVGGVSCAVLGGRIGWVPELTFLLYLVPVGIALAVVDWRTRRLPTALIAPSYAIVVALVLFSAWLDRDLGSLITAGWGWLVAGGTYLVMWLVYPRGLGYGDVRLAGVLGIALGYVGWSELLTGVYAGFLLGGLIGGVLSLLRVVDRKAYPFGPFMLVGALVGILLGPGVAAWYAGGP